MTNSASTVDKFGPYVVLDQVTRRKRKQNRELLSEEAFPAKMEHGGYNTSTPDVFVLFEAAPSFPFFQTV
ncbi:hypothetical protein Bca52824_029478 [Brassica carinata]|uniref:Uncharacterized protein n=1 Tax=Brassica carinata TaxID=52824 RepID=A0A8X8APV4_BRACI|nr:hypothetical protein Bca52824_029478 [Brassica carinata]